MNMTNLETLIPQIKKSSIDLKWNNQKMGNFIFQKWETTPNINLYFHEYDYFISDDGNEYPSDTYPLLQWEINKYKHVIASGFVAFCLWWIHSKYNKNPYVDLFDTYFVNLRNIFVAEKQRCREYRYTSVEKLNDMFYKPHVKEEKQRSKNSQILFEYLTPQDKVTIKTYIDDYFKHIKNYKLKPLEIIEQKTGGEDKKLRVINESEIRKLFKPILFNRKSTGSNISYADKIIILLKENRKPKTYANIAGIFFYSKFIEHSRDEKFKPFLMKFYDLMGIKNKTYYNEGKLTITKDLKEEFHYLID